MLPGLSNLHTAPVESVPVNSLEKLAAEEVAKQTLTQLDAKAAVRLLKEAGKLHDVLWYTARSDLPMLLAALPKPKESLWIKEINRWYYLSHASRFDLTWAFYSEKPRSITLNVESSSSRVWAGGEVTIVSTTDEVKSVLVPMLEQLNVREEAVADLILAAADYFSTEVGPGNVWMTDSSMLGRRQEAEQLP
jgi:hypothetical protein